MLPIILIVDDDPIVRRLLRQTLIQTAMYNIVEAGSGDAAWKMLNEGLHPTLCILDVMMPGTDGIQLLNLIRSRSATRAVKIIMCTTLNNRLKIAESMSLEVEDYILKPFRPQRITDAVEKALAPRSEKVTAVWGAGGATPNAPYPGVTRAWVQSVAQNIEEALSSLADEDRDRISRKLNDLGKLCSGQYHQDIQALIQELQALVITAPNHEVFERLNRIARLAQQKANTGPAAASG